MKDDVLPELVRAYSNRHSIRLVFAQLKDLMTPGKVPRFRVTKPRMVAENLFNPITGFSGMTDRLRLDVRTRKCMANVLDADDLTDCQGHVFSRKVVHVA